MRVFRRRATSEKLDQLEREDRSSFFWAWVMAIVLAAGFSAHAFWYPVPIGQAAGEVRFSKYSDDVVGEGGKFVVRLQVMLDSGQLVNATALSKSLPPRGTRITLQVRKKWFGFTSYRWDAGAEPVR